MDEIEMIAAQERGLQFTSFSSEQAWAVGSSLRSAALARAAAMTFEIQVAGRTLFLCSTAEAPAGQLDWIRRKRNTVLLFGRSTYALGLELERTGRTMEERHGLAVADYAMHGGGFPIVLRGTGCVGSVIASGLHQRVDHAMVVVALEALLGTSVPHLPATV